MASPNHPRERGIALLLVLWIFMILGVLALDFARYIRDDAMAAVNFADETRGYYLALAGMNRAIYDVERAHERAPGTAGAANAGNRAPNSATRNPQAPDDEEEQSVPPDGQWHEGNFAGGRYSVRMVDESGRIPLNALAVRVEGEVVLTRIVTNLMQLTDRSSGRSRLSHGIGRRDAEGVATIVESILDWRDSDDFKHPHGAESEYYLGLRTPYRAKNGRLDSPEELLLVRGVTADLFYGGPGVPGLRDIFSVYTRQPVLNGRTVQAVVLQAVLGIDAAEASDLVGQRDEDATTFVELLKGRLLSLAPELAAALPVENVEPHVVTIEAHADLDNPRNQSRVAAVADISSDVAEGAKIIRWLDRAPWEGGLPGEPASEGRS